ncbi:TorF family putative porin [Marinilabilia sp.]|uniref:TorF family putative porin n=1 Tax=Marinilabilia sp. TaxID=2021252 RepID=UPI0025C4E8FA|nr:TorF family putative porin [Marinilabilia sp.]
MTRIISFIVLFMISGNILMAQNETETTKNKVNVSVNADLVSRYVWRGLLYSPNVNVQPTLGLTAGNFFAGAWASYGFSDKYAEVDFYAGYSLGNFTLTLSDYYNENELDLTEADHFNWDRETTTHALEGTLNYYFGQECPLTLTAATFFYGNDRDVEGENNYSTYFEAKYNWQLNDGYQLSGFAGGTPSQSLYAADAALVNVGLKLGRTIAINEQISLPIEASLISNPEAEDIFFVLKATF